MNIQDNIFFIIPIYRCTPDKYKQENDAERKKMYNDFLESFQGLQKKERLAEESVDKSMLRKWVSWKYNEIVGYIELYTFFDQIRGDYYFIENQRIRRGFKKNNFVYQGKLFEMYTVHMKTNEEIFEKLIIQLGAIKSERGRLKNKYIDLSELENLGSYIDWINLIKKNY